MRPTILKLLKQETVTQAEWQDLFFSVHAVCVWNDKGALKLLDALKEDIMDFIKQAQQVYIILSLNKKIYIVINKKNYYFIYLIESFSTPRRTSFIKSIYS